jgi:hypothetical protein
VQGVYRDRGQLPPVEKTPGIILLDGTERIRTSLEDRNFTAMPDAVFTMRPQVFMVLTPRDDLRNETLGGISAPIGPEISSFRMKILSAILGDETLPLLVGDNGSVVYEGMDTDMQTGSTMGELGATIQFHFAISYVLNLSNLA